MAVRHPSSVWNRGNWRRNFPAPKQNFRPPGSYHQQPAPPRWDEGIIYNLGDDHGFVYCNQLRVDAFFSKNILPKNLSMSNILPGMKARIKVYRQQGGRFHGQYQGTVIEIDSKISEKVIEGIGLVHETANTYAVIQKRGQDSTDCCAPMWSHPDRVVPDVHDRVHFLAVPRNLKIPEEPNDNQLIFWWHLEEEDCPKSFDQGFTHFRNVMLGIDRPNKQREADCEPRTTESSSTDPEQTPDSSATAPRSSRDAEEPVAGDSTTAEVNDVERAQILDFFSAPRTYGAVVPHLASPPQLASAVDELSDFLGFPVEELRRPPTPPPTSSTEVAPTPPPPSLPPLAVTSEVAPSPSAQERPPDRFVVAESRVATPTSVSSQELSEGAMDDPYFLAVKSEAKRGFRAAGEILEPGIHKEVTGLCVNIYKWAVGGSRIPPSRADIEREMNILKEYTLLDY